MDGMSETYGITNSIWWLPHPSIRVRITVWIWTIWTKDNIHTYYDKGGFDISKINTS